MKSFIAALVIGMSMATPQLSRVDGAWQTFIEPQFQLSAPSGWEEGPTERHNGYEVYHFEGPDGTSAYAVVYSFSLKEGKFAQAAATGQEGLTQSLIVAFEARQSAKTLQTDSAMLGDLPALQQEIEFLDENDNPFLQEKRALLTVSTEGAHGYALFVSAQIDVFPTYEAEFKHIVSSFRKRT